MLSLVRRSLWVIIFCCWSQVLYALIAIPSVGRVVDLTQTLNNQQQIELTTLLQQFENQHGSQIAVLILPSTEPESIEQYSLRVAEKWQLGRKKIDDGVLLVVAMKDKTMRIEVGYGLEGTLNDATCKRIIAEIITPFFKQAQFYQGIRQGVVQMMQVIKGEALPPPSTFQGGHFSLTGNLVFAIVIGSIFASSIFRSILGDSSKKKLTVATVIGLIVTIIIGALTLSWLYSALLGLVAFIGALLGYSGKSGGFGGSGGGFSSGGGSFSGGGGSFGGGGSSGRW